MISKPATGSAEDLLARAWALMNDDLEQCVALAQAASRAAQTHGDGVLAGVAQALALIGLAKHGAPQEAVTQVMLAREKALSLGSQRGVWVCDDLQSVLDLRAGHAEAARQRLRQLDAVPPTARSLPERRFTVCLLQALEFNVGNHETALPLAHRQLALARASGVATHEGLALLALSAVHLVVMDDEAGLPMLEQACALMSESASKETRELGHANRVYALYAAGRLAEAACALQAWVDDCGPQGDGETRPDRCQVSFALGHLAAKQLDRAEALLGDTPPAPWLERTQVAGWYWARGWLLLAQACPEEAETLCHAYLASTEAGEVSMPPPLDARQLQMVLRSAAEARGDRQQALRATQAMRDIEIPMLRVHARVRLLSTQWQLRAGGHAMDPQLAQQRLNLLERSIAAHERDWMFDIAPHPAPPSLPAPSTAGGAQRQVAHLGHEIRTPLSGLMGLTELLLQTSLDPQQRQLVTLARSTADSLMRLLNDLLDMAKMEAGHLKLRLIPFSLAELAEECAGLCAPLARLRRLEFQLSIDPRLPVCLLGDRDRLRQVLGNLLNNALKFTRSGHVSLAVRCLDDQDPMTIRLEVSDTGTGVDPELRQRLFTEFAQADDTATDGTGLGLAISRRLIHAMGGCIDVADRAGGGSTFWLELRMPLGTGISAASEL